MKKILLSAIALMMSIAMMAVGLGDGSSQSNAIDFDWDGTYIHEANNTSWHCIKLSKLSEEADDPTVALYLTNLTNERANVELSGSAVLRFPYPISLFVKDIDLLQYAGDDATATYEIEGKKHVVWTMPTSYDLSSISDAKVRDALAQAFGDISNVSLLQLVEFGLNDVYLEVFSDKQIAIAANVYETAEIVDDACTKAVDFEWSGETVEAGETWFYLDLNEVKNSGKKLNFVVENNGTVDAIVAFDLYADCPASAILLDYDWTIPAGDEVKEALGRFFLDQMTRDYVYLKLTTDQSVTLKAEEEVLPPPVELFDPSAAPVLEVGEEYVLNGVTVLKVDLAALKAPKGYKTVCHIVNPNDAAVNLKQEIAFATPVTSNNVQEKNLLVEANADLDINVPNKQIESVKSDVAYFRLTTGDALTLWMEHVKLETSTTTPSTPAILAPTCEESYAFDWNSSVKQKALTTKWYELDIAPLKNNKEHVQLSFTNHSDSMVVVFGSILLDCNSKDTIPLICPIPAGMQINKVVDYSLLAASPLEKVYVSLTMIPTAVQDLRELASIRTREDIVALVSLNMGAEVEVKATKSSAVVDPTACLDYQTLDKGVEYNLEAGTTKWYRVTDEFVKNDLGLLEKLTIINKGVKDANVTFGVTVGCNYGIATTINQSVPTWFDLTTYCPTGLFRLVDAVVAEEITEFYLSITTDQPMLFGFDLDYGTTLGCDSAIPFNWEKGAVINARDAQWLDFDLTNVKGTGKHVKLTFTNHADSLVWVASAVSLDCPFKAVMPLIVPVPAGLSVDKVIDYSFVAAPAIDNIYVAVVTDGKVELKATLIDATVDEPGDCMNYVDVKSGERYVHQAGTTWYRFSDDLLENMGSAPRFSFENLSSNAITLSAGVTVDCNYGILTKAKAKIPGHVLGKHLHNREFSTRIPRKFFTAARKLIDQDETDFMLQLTANNPFAFSIDMQSNDECGDAQDLLLEGCYDLKANEDKWFKLDVHAIDTLSESLNLIIYKDTDADLYLEAEASPVCPMMLSITEKRTIAFEDSLGMTLSPELLKEKLQEYSKYIAKDMSCYIRLKSNCDLTICVNAVPPVPVDPCETVEVLNWTDAISLNSLENKLYKLDVAALHTLSETSKKKGIRLIINNDVEAGATLITEVYADCMDEAPITGSYSEVVFNELGDTTLRVPYAKFESLGFAPEQTEMYLKVIDIVPPTCDKVMPTENHAICAGESYEWHGQVLTEAGAYKHEDVLACGVVTYTLNLSVTDDNKVMPTESHAICAGESYAWHGQVLTEAGPYTYKDVLACGVVTYTLNLSVTDDNKVMPTESHAICAGESYAWHGKVYEGTEVGTKTYTATDTLSCGVVTYTLALTVINDDTVMDVEPKTICLGETYTWHGKVYEGTEVGTKTYTATDTLSCGVVTYTLKLTVNYCPDPCLDAELVSWKDPFFFEANTDKWYKVDVAGVVDAGHDLKFTVFNRDQAQTIFIGYALECPYNEEDLTSIKSEFGANEFKHYNVSAEKLQTTGAYDYVYVHIVTEGEAIAYAYPTTSCAEADKINWYDPIHLEGKMNKWYKMDLTDAILANMDVPVTIINGDAENTIVIEYATDCPYEEEDLARVPAKDLAANDTLSRVITAQELATSGAYELYVHVVTKGAVGVEPDVEPCMYAEPLKVECGTTIKLEANADKWYKLDVAAIRALDDNVRLLVENGSEDNTISVEYGVECPTDPWTTKEPYTISANAKKTAIITQNDLDMAGAIDYVYVHITTTGELTATVKCCYEYATITGSVCDGDTYVDPITGKEHVISSLIAASQTWNDTVITDLACDSIYTFVITPTVAPQVMTEDLLATIPGALPTLNPGCTVDVAGTIEAIKAYYELNDTEAIADVVNVEWTAGADAELACDATEHTMTLKVEAGCDFVINTTIKFTVEPINVDDAGTTDAEVCEGESYTWAVNGVIYTPTKDTTVVEVKKNECGCEFEKYTLNLTIKTRPAGTTTYASTCPGTKYTGWEKNPSGEYGVGTHYFPLEADVDCDVAIDTLVVTEFLAPEDVVEYDTICPGETITWNGETFATAGKHTLTLQNENGCDYQATLHLHIPDPENFVDYDQIPAESKYGGRMMVINLNAIDSIFGWRPAEGDVKWFKVVGEVDNAFDALNNLGDPAELDELVHTGYYHTALDGSVMPDSYYALIVHEMVSGECQEILRTTVLSSGAAVQAPQLVPTIAEPNDQLRILNLNPSNVTEVRVFNTSGELIENYTASEATEFVFKAATMQGYYMVEVQSENDKVTLRYIVK